MSDEICICSNDVDEIPFALVKAKKLAEETGKLIWIYSHDLFFWMKESYPENEIVVAKVYPGGRTELRRKVYYPKTAKP